MIVHAIFRCDHTGKDSLVQIVQHAAKAQHLVDQLNADDTQGDTFWSQGVSVIVDEIDINVRDFDAAWTKVMDDAARYQWLRQQPNDPVAPRIDVVQWFEADGINEGIGLRREKLDRAIDEQMTNHPQVQTVDEWIDQNVSGPATSIEEMEDIARSYDE